MPKIDTYLFDWGDTLMVDIPGMSGKMCDWPSVQAVADAEAVLSRLSQQADIYVATGAQDSTVAETEQALARVDLAQYIKGIFCKANVGMDKGTPEFFQAILNALNKEAAQVIVVGDNLEKDIEPALALGLNVAWLVPSGKMQSHANIKQIEHLSELLP